MSDLDLSGLGVTIVEDEEDDDDDDNPEDLAMLQKFFDNCTVENDFRPDEQEVLARVFDLIPFEEGDTIIQQGETASWAGLLLEGTFDAYVEGVGKVGSVPPGGFVGEMTVFEGGKRNATCKAASKGTIGAVLLTKLDDMYLDYPSFHVKLLQ